MSRPPWHRSRRRRPRFAPSTPVGGVVQTVAQHLPDLAARIRIDDGSGDGTADATCSRRQGDRARAKSREGAALVTMRAARADGYALALTVDADGQHSGPFAGRVVADALDPSAPSSSASAIRAATARRG
ncbi:MAG: hypothetical protein U0235_27410 [Polyangiaceae bacterium]